MRHAVSSGFARIRAPMRALLRDDDAIAVTEYGLLIALVALALIVVLQAFGSSISAWFKGSTDTVTSASP